MPPPTCLFTRAPPFPSLSALLAIRAVINPRQATSRYLATVTLGTAMSMVSGIMESVSQTPFLQLPN